MATNYDAVRAAVRKARNSRRRLSHIIWEALETQPHVTLLDVLVTQVLPGTDVRCFNATFRQVLEIVRASLVCKDEVDRLINFTVHQQDMNLLAELRDKLQAAIDAGYGPETADVLQQQQVRQDIEDEVQSWLQSLFQVGILRGLHLVTVQRCLIFMEGHMMAVMNAKSILAKEYFPTSSECRFTSKGDLVYKNSPEIVIHCFWRDLLLTAIVQNDKAVLNEFKAHAATNAGLRLADALCEKVGFGHDILHYQAEQVKLFCSCHTADMEAAMPELIAFLQE